MPAKSSPIADISSIGKSDRLIGVPDPSINPAVIRMLPNPKNPHLAITNVPMTGMNDNSTITTNHNTTIAATS